MSASWYRRTFRRLRLIGHAAFGHEVCPRRDVRTRLRSVGPDGAEWWFSPEHLCDGGVAYSFGIGEDLSLERSLATDYGLEVHAFDPSPASLRWLRTQACPPSLHTHAVGVAHFDGIARFSPPAEPDHVSYTMAELEDRESSSDCNVLAADRPAVALPVRSLTTLSRHLGHREVTLLKLDVEGAEHRVLETWAGEDPRVLQLLVEFHHDSKSVEQTRSSIEMLRSLGFLVAHVSGSGREYCFLNRDCLE